MDRIATVDSLYRYPVKSMRGEELQEAFLGYPGVYGDRLYAFHSTAAPKSFPYLTAREQESMLLYQPRYRHPERTVRPLNQHEAESRGSGLTSLYGPIEDFVVDVETPGGEVLPLDDKRLLDLLSENRREKRRPTHSQSSGADPQVGQPEHLTLLRSQRAMTDCSPVSIFSLETVAALSQEMGLELDKRRFRANLYIRLEAGKPFGEEEFVGQMLRIGSRATVAVLKRDSRCKMITLDPDTAHMKPDILRSLAQNHDNNAGVYGAVLIEGSVYPGDEIVLV